MPLYEYECPEGHRTEAIFFNVTQRNPPRKIFCEHQVPLMDYRGRSVGVCGERAERIMSASTAVFKGEGWDKRSTNERRVKL